MHVKGGYQQGRLPPMYGCDMKSRGSASYLNNYIEKANDVKLPQLESVKKLLQTSEKEHESKSL